MNAKMRAHYLLGFVALLVACKPSASVTSDPATTATTSATPAVSTSPPAPSGSPPSTVPTPKDPVMAANDFSLGFYAKARAAKGNALVSGTSLRTALGIAYLGARGDTAKQMASALGLGAPEAAAEELKNEAAIWGAARGTNELAVANRLWLAKAYAFLPDFVGLATSAAGAPPENVDFSASEPTRKTINDWVSERTKTKIPEILPQGSITELTRFVVTNAIYFKASWAQAFKPQATRDDPFTTDAGKIEQVKTMHQVASFRVGKAPGARVLEMPYANSTLAMNVILPDDPKGLEALESTLSAATLSAWTSSLLPDRIDLALPKFTFRSGGPVKDALKAMGITHAFDKTSDFTGVTKAEELYISDVFHQTFIAVDEQGTEAAAASAVVGTTRGLGGPPPPTPFKVDRPFLFLIRDTKSGRVLFVGRVTNPKT